MSELSKQTDQHESRIERCCGVAVLWAVLLVNIVRSRMIIAMWRPAQPKDDDSLADMCLQLFREDPGLSPVPPHHMRATIAQLRREPWRGRVVILDVQGQPSGYALLIAFWSNELGGDACVVDELFVVAEHRSQGYGRSLFAAIEQGELWPAPIVAIALGVTPNNVRARQLYERLGFTAVGVSMIRRLPPLPLK